MADLAAASEVPLQARARSGGIMLLALFLAGLSLRPQLVGIGPLLPLIQDDLLVTHAVAGLLVTIPVFCMAASPLLAPVVSEWLSIRAAVLLSLGILAVAGFLRAIAPDMNLILLTSLLVGIGLGIGGALLPVAVREHFPDRPAFATGIYTAGLQVGASSSSAVAVPISVLAGSWRGALVAFSGVIALVAIIWTALVSGEGGHKTRILRPPPLPWRRGIVWTIAILFAFRSCIFQGMNAWLAAIFVEHGWSPTEAGALVAVQVFAGFPTTLLVSRLADRSGSRRTYLVAGSVGMIIGTAGILLLPDFGWVWAPILGIGMGIHFPITLTLPLDVAETRTEVAGATALVLGAGYTASATAPILLGALRDVAGTFTPVMVVMVLLACGALVVSLLMADVRQREPQPAGAAG